MTDTNPPESGQLGVDGETNSQVAQTGVKQTSSSANQSQAEQDRLTRLEKMVESLQSKKDKGITKEREEIEQLRTQFGEVQRLMKKGLSEDEAFDQLESRKGDAEFKNAVIELRDFLQGRKSLPAGNGAVDVAEVASKFGLDPKDPEFIVEMSAKKFDTPELAELAVRRFKDKQAGKPQPSDADALAKSASTPKSNLTAQEIEAKSAELTKMYKNPSKFKAQINALEKELESYLPK